MQPNVKLIEVLMRAHLQSLWVMGREQINGNWAARGLQGSAGGSPLSPSWVGRGCWNAVASVVAACRNPLCVVNLVFLGTRFSTCSLLTLVAIRVAARGDRGLRSRDVGLVWPTRNRALGRLSGSPWHLGAQRKDSCSPTAHEHPSYTASCGLFGM